MKTGAGFFIAATVLFIFGAWATRQTDGIKKASWLTGTWVNRTPKGNIYETWSRTNDTTLSGKSYLVKGKDTLVFENIQLVQEQNGLFYIPTVKNQNGGLPVRFANKTASATQLVFENPQHDFPQVIFYTKITSDSLLAEISGTKNGRERKQAFPMKRVK